MARTVFQSRFCRFEVPEGWEVVPGLGAREGGAHGRANAVVVEGWLDRPETARSYSEAQKQALLEAFPGAEVLEEREVRSERIADGHLLTVRSGTVADRLLQTQLAAVEGRLACTMTFSGPEQSRQTWQRELEMTLGTFAVAAGWAGAIEEARLLVEPGERRSGRRARLPAQQLSIPDPGPGWSLDDAAGTLRAAGGATVEVRNLGTAGGAADERFAAALERAHRDGRTPRRWQRGELRDGRVFRALDSVVQAPRTWGPPQVDVTREVMIEDDGVIELHARFIEGEEAAGRLLAEIASGYAWLPPEERRLEVREGWLDTELTGAWRAASPGLYLRDGAPPLLAFAQLLPGYGALHHATTMSDALRGDPEVARIVDQHWFEGAHRGGAAVRWGLDFLGADGSAVSLRCAWLDARERVCLLLVRGGAASEVEALFARLLERAEPRRWSCGEQGGQPR